MPIEVVCSKCNYTIYRIKVLRAIKDILRDNRCPNCNSTLLNEFTISAERI